jgi:hypothetical protein
MPPLDGRAVRLLEEALVSSPTKTLLLEMNKTFYLLSREGRWFKFSLLTKKRTIKKAAIFQTLTDLYNQAVHGSSWRIASNSLS